eukprot:scaffold11979_cov75-Skeletonema_dohrnii-CCMP3373.AAC.1
MSFGCWPLEAPGSLQTVQRSKSCQVARIEKTRRTIKTGANEMCRDRIRFRGLKVTRHSNSIKFRSKFLKALKSNSVPAHFICAHAVVLDTGYIDVDNIKHDGKENTNNSSPSRGGRRKSPRIRGQQFGNQSDSGGLKKRSSQRERKSVTSSTTTATATTASTTASTTAATATANKSSRKHPSSLKPTITFPPKEVGIWDKKQLSMEEIAQKFGLDEDVQCALRLVANAVGHNATFGLLKVGLRVSQKIYNDYVASGCKNPPCRNDAATYHFDMGADIESHGFVANMGDLAQSVTRGLAMMHYATLAESLYKHPTLDHCKMDYGSPCPSLVAKAVPNMAMYHTTNMYNEPRTREEIVLMDMICLCLEKGNQRDLDEQLRKFLKTLGILDYFEEASVPLYAAVSIFIIPVFIFNVCQIHFNNKEAAPVLAVGNKPAQMFRNGCTTSNSHVHGCGTMVHPDALTDPMKVAPEQSYVNSDACIVEWCKTILRHDLEQLGISADDIRCYISYNFKYGHMSDDERQCVLESLPSHILKQVKRAVEEVMHLYPTGTSRSFIAAQLTDINTRWVTMYLADCESGGILTEMKEKVEEVMHQYPKGTRKSSIVRLDPTIDEEAKSMKHYLASCKNGEILTDTKEKVEAVMHQYPKGTRKSSIVRLEPTIDEEAKSTKRYLASCKNGEVTSDASFMRNLKVLKAYCDRWGDEDNFYVVEPHNCTDYDLDYDSSSARRNSLGSLAYRFWHEIIFGQRVPNENEKKELLKIGIDVDNEKYIKKVKERHNELRRDAATARAHAKAQAKVARKSK